MVKIKKLNSKKEWLHGLGLSFWAFIVIIIILGFVFAFRLGDLTSALVSEHGLLAILLTSFITDFLVQPVGPDVPLVLGVLGSKHNLVAVFALVLKGSYAALFCAYFIGRKIGFSGLEKIVGKKKYEKVINSPHYGKWILVITSFSPVPYIPYLAGMWELSFKQVVLYVAVPRTIRFFIVLLLALYIGRPVLDWLLL